MGELAALDRGTRTATATATEATTADYVPQDMFETSLAAAPEASRRLLRMMAGRLRATDQLVAELAGAHDPAAADVPPPVRKPVTRNHAKRERV